MPFKMDTANLTAPWIIVVIKPETELSFDFVENANRVYIERLVSAYMYAYVS